MANRSSKIVALASLLAAALAPAAAFAGGNISFQTFYEESASKVCRNLGGCRPTFLPVPVGKVLIVTNLSCRLDISPITNTVVETAQLQGNDLPTELNIAVLGNSSSKRIASINANMAKIFKAGEVPAASFYVTKRPSFFLVTCTLDGQLLGENQ